jgi:hypothetical protein
VGIPSHQWQRISCLSLVCSLFYELALYFVSNSCCWQLHQLT